MIPLGWNPSTLPPQAPQNYAVPRVELRPETGIVRLPVFSHFGTPTVYKGALVYTDLQSYARFALGQAYSGVYMTIKVGVNP